MKKIAFVLGNYKNGGMAMRATNLSNEFSNRNYIVYIIVTKEIGNNFFLPSENVSVISIKDYNNNPECFKHYNDLQKRKNKVKRIKRFHLITRHFKNIDRYFSKKVSLIQYGDELRDFFLNTQPDVVIPFGLAYLKPVVSATKGLDCQIFYAEKNAPEIEFPPRESYEFNYLISLMKKINGVIVQSNVEKQFFNGLLQNVFVINNPIKQGLPMPHTGERKKTIVNFCRMSAQKNIGLLLDAFVKIRNDFPDYTLTIFGNTVEKSEFEYKESIIKKVDDLGLNDNVNILPPVSDVHYRVIDSAMFVSSSDYEGLSNSMIEAMAIGLPCICTDCLGGGTREVMIDERNGLIVPMNDVEALYKAMKRFIENPEFAELCGRNAAKIREKLNVNRIAQQWINIFQR